MKQALLILLSVLFLCCNKGNDGEEPYSDQLSSTEMIKNLSGKEVVVDVTYTTAGLWKYIIPDGATDTLIKRGYITSAYNTFMPFFSVPIMKFTFDDTVSVSFKVYPIEEYNPYNPYIYSNNDVKAINAQNFDYTFTITPDFYQYALKNNENK